MATEARPAFVAITGPIESENLAAAVRFSACLREACGDELPAAVVATATLAARAFGGDRDAWAPLVAAVRQLLAASSAAGAQATLSRRELRAFVSENADLLEADS